ncbi:ABC transporter permease [soil metagenome]
MGAFLSRRLIDLVIALLGVSLIVFMSVRLVPGDPARLVAGTEASESDIAAVRERLGLTDSLVEQYGRYMEGLVTGDMGQSLRNNQPVTDLLLSRASATMRLALASLVVALVIGMSSGILAALRRGSLIDLGSMAFALLGASMPSFWLGLLLILLFSVNLGWLPTGNDGGIDHLILPAITLGTANAAIIARLVRANLLEVLQQDYVQTARAKGLTPKTVLFGHALRNAMIPTVTILGLQWGTLLAGSVVTETVFAWPGLGRLLIDAVAVRDYPVIQGCVMVFALVFMVTNLMVDISYALLNPRIRLA